jgi:hypothetical protein
VFVIGHLAMRIADSESVRIPQVASILRRRTGRARVLNLRKCIHSAIRRRARQTVLPPSRSSGV